RAHRRRTAQRRGEEGATGGPRVRGSGVGRHAGCLRNRSVPTNGASVGTYPANAPFIGTGRGRGGPGLCGEGGADRGEDLLLGALAGEAGRHRVTAPAERGGD